MKPVRLERKVRLLQRPRFFLSCQVSFLLIVVFFSSTQIFGGRGEQWPNTGISKQTYTYKKVGDLEIRADVFRSQDSIIRPGIIEIHGGALIMGERQSPSREEMEKYARAGYVVISIDYRLAPETKISDIIGDIQDFFIWVQTNGPRLFSIDPRRLGVTGGSAGGYLTLMTGFCVHPRPKALVSYFGYGDITGPWLSRPSLFYVSSRAPITKEEAYSGVNKGIVSGSTARPDDSRALFYLYCRQHGIWPEEVTAHDPDKDPRFFDAFCPIRNVTRDYPPTMLLHGDKDTDVPFEQSAQMAIELGRKGVEYVFIPMPNAGHGFDTSLTFDRALAFFNKHLQ